LILFLAMAVRQLSNRLPAVFLQQQLLKQATAAGQEGLQQGSSKQLSLFQRLLAGLTQNPQRHYSQAFQPTRLYPKRHQSSESLAFWGIVGLNAATTIIAKSESPDVRWLVSQHFKTSVAAIADGRWYTVLTSSICHTSVVHCAINLLMLALYRRTQPLGAAEVRYSLSTPPFNATHFPCLLRNATCPLHPDAAMDLC
jgi:hypothetical protein